MLKKLMITTAVSALLIGTATAQGIGTQRPGEPPATPPAAKSETKSDTTSAAKSTEMSKPAPAPTTAKFVNSQRPDQFLASKFKGTDVLGPRQCEDRRRQRHPVRQGRQDRSLRRGRRRLPGHRRQGRRARADRLPGRVGRQVEERVRQAEDLHDQGPAQAGGELRAVQGPEHRPPAWAGRWASRPAGTRPAACAVADVFVSVSLLALSSSAAPARETGPGPLFVVRAHPARCDPFIFLSYRGDMSQFLPDSSVVERRRTLTQFRRAAGLGAAGHDRAALHRHAERA